MGVYLKKGDWYIDYYADGRRLREKVGPSKKLAQDVLRKRKVQIAEGWFLDIKQETKIKFRDFAKTYLEKHAIPNKKSWKKSDAVSLVRLVPFFGESYLYEIKPLDIIDYKAQRFEEVSAATVNRELACLKVMFSKAIEWELVSENPVKKVKFYKEDNRRLRYLEKEEIERLLANCPASLRAIVILAISTGMRKSEIQHLRWRDVDFANNVITLLITKNGEVRHIPLMSYALEALKTQNRHPSSDYIFCDTGGLPFNFRKSFETALRKSDIFGFRFHDLRHTFASHLAMSGVDLNTIRALLGHKSLDMTLRYSHLSKSHKTQAIEVLSERLDTLKTPSAKELKLQTSENLVSSINLDYCIGHARS